MGRTLTEGLAAHDLSLFSRVSHRAADARRVRRDLRRSLLEPPAQLRPRTVTASQDGDADGNVTAVA